VFVVVIMGLFFVARLQNFTHKSARSSSPSSQVAVLSHHNYAEPPQLSIVDRHNLSIDGADKDIMLCPKSQENHYTKSSS
jgi:hypothetical protein